MSGFPQVFHTYVIPASHLRHTCTPGAPVPYTPALSQDDSAKSLSNTLFFCRRGVAMSTIGSSIMDYLSTLILFGGDHDGEAFTVLPRGKCFIQGAFSQPGVTALSVARGDGKSALVTGLACVVEDLLAFLGAKHDLENRRLWRKQDSADRAWIEYRPTGAQVRCLGSDPKRASGLGSYLALLDEPAVWDARKRDRMVQTIRTGLGKSPGSRLLALGTRPCRFRTLSGTGFGQMSGSSEGTTGTVKTQ